MAAFMLASNSAAVLDWARKELAGGRAGLGWRPSLVGWRPWLLGWRPPL